MLKKLNNKKGFTLMEMLIVVAIIAVLVAIAIPVFNGALTKSKEAADVANIRAAYAEWQVAILTDGEKLPNDADAFLAGPTGSDGYKLNYYTKGATSGNKLAFTAATNDEPAKITYEAAKLTGGNGTGNNADHIFTWNMAEATFTDN